MFWSLSFMNWDEVEAICWDGLSLMKRPTNSGLTLESVRARVSFSMWVGIHPNPVVRREGAKLAMSKIFRTFAANF